MLRKPLHQGFLAFPTALLVPSIALRAAFLVCRKMLTSTSCILAEETACLSMPVNHRLIKLGLILTLLASGCNLTGAPEGPIPTSTPAVLPGPTVVPPDPVPAAATALFNGDYDTARAQYTAAAGSPVLKCSALYQLGVTNLRAKQYADAEQALTRALSECPPTFRAYVQRGEARRLLGKKADALADYQQAQALKPGLIDSYLYERMSLADGGATLTYLQKAAESPRYLAGQFLLRDQLAQAYLHANDPASALKQYEAILSAAQKPDYKADVEVEAANAEVKAGQTAAAYTRLNRVLTTAPVTSAAFQAMVMLVNADQPVDLLLRTRLNVQNNNLQPVVDLLSGYLAQTPANQIPAELYVLYGQAQRGLGDTKNALVSFQKVRDAYPADPMASTAALEQGRTYFVANDYPHAIAAYTAAAATYPKSPEAPEALWRAAYLEQTYGDAGRALTLYDQLGKSYPATDRAQQGSFDAGLMLAATDPARAAAFFSRVTDARGMLWQGKMLQKTGNTSGAKQVWTAAYTKEPTTFFGLRAYDLLNGTAPYQPAPAMQLPQSTDADRAAAEKWMRETFKLPAAPTILSPALVNDPMLVRGAELQALGWWSEATAEFDALHDAKRDDPLAMYQLAVYYKGLGVYRSSIISATRVIVLANQQTGNIPAYIARLAYPIDYADVLIPDAQAYNVDPLFFSALIRLESNFDANARSGSDARGLTQVVPATAGDIVGRLNWPPNYTEDDLYRPLVSLRFGAYYVDFVRRFFGGNLAATLAGYNAGPGAASGWLQKTGNDLDLFYETVESQQAQEYVRYTYEYFAVYRRLYGRKP